MIFGLCIPGAAIYRSLKPCSPDAAGRERLGFVRKPGDARTRLIPVDPFTQQLLQWQWFFGTVTGSSATLAGLLFVSLSVNRAPGEGLSERKLAQAQRSFGDFLYVIMMGLVFLVPHEVPIGLSLALFVLGGARAAGLVREELHHRRVAGGRRELGEFVRSYGLPGMASLGLIAVAVEILRGDMRSIFAMVLVIAALLTTASWHAWMMLIQEAH